jgi:hypothetical protein
MPKKTNEKMPVQASQGLPALPMKRTRRRVVRASHSWCFRRPPSRKRVETSQGRALPERNYGTVILPMSELHS